MLAYQLSVVTFSKPYMLGDQLNIITTAKLYMLVLSLAPVLLQWQQKGETEKLFPK